MDFILNCFICDFYPLVTSIIFIWYSLHSPDHAFFFFILSGLNISCYLLCISTQFSVVLRKAITKYYSTIHPASDASLV